MCHSQQYVMFVPVSEFCYNSLLKVNSANRRWAYNSFIVFVFINVTEQVFYDIVILT